jgi:hypothetical protein
MLSTSTGTSTAGAFSHFNEYDDGGHITGGQGRRAYCCRVDTIATIVNLGGRRIRPDGGLL